MLSPYVRLERNFLIMKSVVVSDDKDVAIANVRVIFNDLF